MTNKIPKDELEFMMQAVRSLDQLIPKHRDIIEEFYFADYEGVTRFLKILGYSQYNKKWYLEEKAKVGDFCEGHIKIKRLGFDDGYVLRITTREYIY